MFTDGIYLIFRPDQSYRIFNTWMGEPSKIQILNKILEIIKRDNVLENVQSTGSLMLKQLKEFQVCKTIFAQYHNMPT